MAASMGQSLRIALWSVLSLWLPATAVPAGGATGTIDAAALVQHGGSGVVACSTCHGAAGRGNPAMPITPYLAGLPAAYLQRQLREMAGGARTAGPMSVIARSLTEAQIRALASYLAGLPRPSAPPRGSRPSPLGRQLADQGRWSQGLPACVLCHGRRGVGVGEVFPPLAGQSAVYLVRQLSAFKDGSRAAGPLGLMKVVANRLSVRDMRAVAAYFSSLPAATRREPGS